MDKEKMLEVLDLPKLTKKDTFSFGCNMCGECCHNRDENVIMLNPLDVYKIAKYLNMEVKDFLFKYCHGYCGEDSKLPFVILKAKMYRGVCPFLKDKCTIHPVKPAVCALFPLGRMTNSQTKEFTYFQHRSNCGDKKKTQTIEEYLAEFGILEEEQFTILWQQKCLEYATKLMKLQKKFPNLVGDFIFLGTILYLHYDITKDFTIQFEENCKVAEELLKTAINFKGSEN